MISILGSGGYLGSILSEFFLSRNYDVISISRSFQWTNSHSRNKFITAAVSCTDLYREDILSSEIIIYMAGSTNISEAQLNPADDLIDHISELRTFFDIFKSQSFRPKYFLFFSSAGAVYGDSLGIYKSEDMFLSPKSVYGKRNCILEDVVSNYCSILDIQYSIFRIANPYGPTQHLFRRKGLIQSLLHSSNNNQSPLILRGNGNQKRDYLYSNDLCNIVFELVQMTSLPNIINICSGTSLSAREIIDIMNSRSIFPNFSYIPDQPVYEVKDSLLSNKLLTSLLDTSIIRPLSLSQYLSIN